MKIIQNPSEYLPHRPPFLLIDELVVMDQDNFSSRTNPEGKLYLTRNGIPEDTFLIENIAQTCAAAFGMLARESKGEPQIGYIGAVTRLQVHHTLTSVKEIRTSIRVLQRFGTITLVEGVCHNHLGEQLLNCEMKIVLASEE
jgi:predicted hotdog family 3-hydroxylacyl-ACP dehydratase